MPKHNYAGGNYAQRYFYEHLLDVTDECMVWPYYTNPKGYGRVRLKGRPQLVAHLACVAWHGPRPEGMEAAHGPCHNPACWNGAHLSWKTRKENLGPDMARDGTLRRGEAAPCAKLTAPDVLTIRRLCAEGATQRAIAATYGLGQSTVAAIATRRSWAWLADN